MLHLYFFLTLRVVYSTLFGTGITFSFLLSLFFVFAQSFLQRLAAQYDASLME